ncbi:hypothetical protein IFM89_009897 [Coptis chinensis]|uniref:DDHD domain-containing protein n=1 Tax=Coptis chinensis TaxID=261450 RepID=A0A835M2P5_9MAGN|nr:hypothetical protein IFM89_009897 [Coptis chinensis]
MADDIIKEEEEEEEARIDLLKNTPSNIARLEDVIDQCKARQKYLAQTKSSCDGEDVRWYFCKLPLSPNELAASVPRTDVVGKGEYFRFGMRDSLALEASFLQREEELLSFWWKEYAECSDGPSGRHVSSNTKFDSQPKSFPSESDRATQSFEAEGERVGVPVKGGLYEVDLAKRHCFPVYWSGENRRVLRGHWFARKASLDWLPLREDVAEQLEFAYRSKVWHRRTFQPSGLFAARVDMQGSMPGLHALFTGEDDNWDAWLSNDASGFSNVISIRGNGVKLRRGYSSSGSPKPTQDELRQQKEEEMDDYCSQVPVGHLVFMVHGIGQRLEKANLVDDVGNYRQITASLAERHLTSFQRDTQRVLFIPCQWRKGLKLGGESAVENITLDGVRGLRVMLSATAHDILYYMSPIYCQEIINSVSNQLNWLYKKFVKRNPGYDGKVSIYGHSLGSVLSYDILCHQEDLSSPFPMESLYKERVRREENQPLQSNESSSQFSLPMNLESKISTTTTENLEVICQEECNQDPDAVAYDSPTSILQKTTSSTDPENVPESKQSTESSLEEDVEEQGTSSTTTETLESMFQEESNKDQCSIAYDSPASDLEEISARTCNENVPESKQSNDVQEHGDDDMLSLEGNHMDSTATRSYGVCIGDVDKVHNNTSHDTSDKANLIKSLMEEVDFLKARIADLESRCDDEQTMTDNHKADDKEIDADTSNGNPSQNPLEEVDMCKGYTAYIKYTKLDFKVDTFFAVGSPLGVFLALRNIRIGIGKGKDYWQDESIIEEMPACRQMFNIFHPFDPVAYRVEPLVCKEYINKRPVIIPYHRGGKRLHIGFQEFTENIVVRSQAVVNHLSLIRVKVLTACQSRNNDDIDESIENSSEIEEKSYGSLMMERLTGNKEGRVDHVLQDKTFEHQYISAIGSHTNYWRDPDTALFILKHLYRDIPEEPTSPGHSGDNSKRQTKSSGRFYQCDTVDDELPLTFSDRMLVKEFSRKVRMAMKNS